MMSRRSGSGQILDDARQVLARNRGDDRRARFAVQLGDDFRLVRGVHGIKARDGVSRAPRRDEVADLREEVLPFLFHTSSHGTV